MICYTFLVMPVLYKPVLFRPGMFNLNFQSRSLFPEVRISIGCMVTTAFFSFLAINNSSPTNKTNKKNFNVEMERSVKPLLGCSHWFTVFSMCLDKSQQMIYSRGHEFFSDVNRLNYSILSTETLC